jgi:hypothetical protein
LQRERRTAMVESSMGVKGRGPVDARAERVVALMLNKEAKMRGRV